MFEGILCHNKLGHFIQKGHLVLTIPVKIFLNLTSSQIIQLHLTRTKNTMEILSNDGESQTKSQILLSKKKRTLKKGPELEQSTKINRSPKVKQMKLDKFIRKPNTSDSITNKSEFLTSNTAHQIQQLEQQIAKKDEKISHLREENDQRRNQRMRKVEEKRNIESETNHAIIVTAMKLAEIARNQRGKIHPQLGYFTNTNCTQFQQGPLLKDTRKQLKQAEQKLNKAQQKIKGKLSNRCNNAPNSQINFYRQQVKELKMELQSRQRQVQKYKQRLRLHQKQKNSQVAKDDWKIIKQRYIPLELIGNGGFGQVYKGIDIKSKNDVAIKMSLPDSRHSQVQYEVLMKYLKRQIQTHKQLNHPNIVKVLDHFQVQGRIYLVMEYCSGPDLKNYFRKCQCLEQRQARQIIRQIIFAVKYLHDQKLKIVHYDLKPANIMFHHGIVKVVDFGICKTMESEETRIEATTPGLGTYYYLPPEGFRHENPIVSSKADIWSIGVIFFELMYGAKPFGQGVSQGKILREGTILNAKTVEFPPQTPKKYKVSNEAKDFIRACLKHDPSQRLSPHQAYEDRYITDWN